MTALSDDTNVIESGGGGGSTAATGIMNQQQYEDALDDVHTRFILNLPDSELAATDRIFFQLEQAWWYYEDWICDLHPEYNFPRYTQFKSFAKMMYEYSSILPNVSNAKFTIMWNEYTTYRRSISTYGCILVTDDYQNMILCQVYNSKTVTFPAGKINHGENGSEAAARETYEETGFDPLCQRGLTSIWKEQTPSKITWNTILLDKDMLVHQDDTNTTTISSNQQQQQQQTTTNANTNAGGKRRTFYIVVGVPADFPFKPVCRKEISDIFWHPIYGPPPKPSYCIYQFLAPLKKYLSSLSNTIDSKTTATTRTPSSGRDKSQSKKRNDNNNNNTITNNTTKGKNAISTPNKKSNTNSRNNSRGRNNNNHSNNSSNPRSTIADNSLIQSGLANHGDVNGWSVEDMFRVNEKLVLHTSSTNDNNTKYDGTNPNIFAEQGFIDGIDPHAFRIVGGTLLNQTKTAVATTTAAKNDYESTIAGINSGNQGNATTTGGIYHLETNDDSSSHPAVSRYQTLFQNDDRSKKNVNRTVGTTSNGDKDTLKPFFSMDGATPWGEVIAEVKVDTNMSTTATAATANSSSNNSSRKKDRGSNSRTAGSRNDVSTTVSKSKQRQPQQVVAAATATETGSKQNDDLQWFTDVEITKRNKEKQQEQVRSQTLDQSSTSNKSSYSELPPTMPSFMELPMSQRRRQSDIELIEKHKQRLQQYKEDSQFIQSWAESLPKFHSILKLDTNAIMKDVDEYYTKNQKVK